MDGNVQRLNDGVSQAEQFIAAAVGNIQMSNNTRYAPRNEDRYPFLLESIAYSVLALAVHTLYPPIYITAPAAEDES